MIRVLIVEDEPITAEAHAQFLARLDGFALAGVAHTARDARQQIAAAFEHGEPIDLILLDLTLPDAHGLDLARALRSARIPVDFIAITAVRQTDAVHAALGAGAVQYLIKPFGFPVFRDKLETYRRYRDQLAGTPGTSTQQEVDDLMSALRPVWSPALPKGLTAETLAAVTALLRESEAAISSSDAGERVGVSRVTARRYLEHLCHVGAAVREQRYGTPGRPESLYRLR